MDWFHRYFIEPIELGYGYNPVNTLAYAGIFVLLTYITFRLLVAMRVKIDRRLGLSVLPFVVFGSLLRVLKDAGVVTSTLFVTPLIWLLLLGVSLLILLVSRLLERKKRIPYYKTMFVMPLPLIAIALGLLEYRNISSVWLVLLYFIPWLVLLRLLRWSSENKFVTALHMFDATVTFVSIKYFGYFEQHVVPRFFIDFTGTPFSFVILKFITVVFVLFMLDKYSDDEDFRNWLRLVIAILALGPGLRDFFRVLCSV